MDCDSFYNAKARVRPIYESVIFKRFLSTVGARLECAFWPPAAPSAPISHFKSAQKTLKNHTFINRQESGLSTGSGEKKQTKEELVVMSRNGLRCNRLG